DYRQALLVGGERATGIAPLRLNLADAIDTDREVALPCRVAGVSLGKPPHDAERLLISCQGCGSIPAFEIDGAQLVKCDRDVTLPHRVIPVVLGKLSPLGERRHRRCAGAPDIARSLVGGGKLVQRLQVEMPKRKIVRCKTGQPLDRVLNSLKDGPD